MDRGCLHGGTGRGLKLGATYDFSTRTRIGIAYQSKLEVEYGGNLEVQPAGLATQSDTELTMAPFVRIGLHHDMNDRLGLNFTIGWDGWSELDHVLLSTDAIGGSAGLDKNWDDTYHYAWGFSYLLDSSWEVTAGVSYDTNPVDSHDRTADLPLDRQVRYNAGARKPLSDHLTVGGYFSYADLGSAKINGEFWEGDYSSNDLFSLSVYLDWRL